MEGKVTPGPSQLGILFFSLPRFLFLTNLFSKLDARNAEKEIKMSQWREKWKHLQRKVSLFCSIKVQIHQILTRSFR